MLTDDFDVLRKKLVFHFVDKYIHKLQFIIKA